MITIDFTDHSPCFLIFKDVKGYTDDEKVKISFRLVTDEYKNVFKTKVEKYNWESIRNNDIDVYVHNFTTTLNKLYCDSFPLRIKYVTKKRLNNKWITPQIKKLIEAKSNYFQLYKLNMVTHEENKFFKN